MLGGRSHSCVACSRRRFMGLFDVLFGGQVNPYTPTPLVSQDMQQKFLQALYGQGLDPQGGFAGMPAYPGTLNPSQNPNLQAAYSNWSPWNAGLAHVAAALPNLGPSPYSLQAQANLNQY